MCTECASRHQGCKLLGTSGNFRFSSSEIPLEDFWNFPELCNPSRHRQLVLSLCTVYITNHDIYSALAFGCLLHAEAYEEEGMCIQVLKVVCVLLIGQTALCQSPVPVQQVYSIARLETLSMSPRAPVAKHCPNLVSC
jgi:hypothetical protein